MYVYTVYIDSYARIFKVIYSKLMYYFIYIYFNFVDNRNQILSRHLYSPHVEIFIIINLR